ncbi:hypothetical protein [Aliihoeflea sp. PC F10.4]
MKIRRMELHRWKVNDATNDLSEMFEDVRKFGRQELEADGIVYEVTVQDPKQSRSAKNYLAAGGPDSFPQQND